MNDHNTCKSKSMINFSDPNNITKMQRNIFI